MAGCRPAVTPTEMGAVSKLTSKDKISVEGQETMAKLPYRKAVRKLLCISSKTRPDICVSVDLAASRVADPRNEDWEGVLRILRYLKGAKNLALFYNRKGNDELEACADANFSSAADRRSLSGMPFKIKDSAVFNRGRNKHTWVALSTADDELISQIQTARETVYVRKVL